MLQVFDCLIETIDALQRRRPSRWASRLFSCAMLIACAACSGPGSGPAETDVDGDGWSVAGGDCDDGDAAIYPGAPERCNARDDDCDGEIDEGDDSPAAWYLDADGDGFGDPASLCVAAAGGPSYVQNGTDCDDSSSAIYPAARELCDGGIDNNCDGILIKCGIFGPLDLAQADSWLKGTTSADYAGVFLSCSSALLGNLWGELAIPAPMIQTAYLFLQPVYGAASLDTADAQVMGSNADNALTGAISAEGDVNGDGRVDVLTAGPLFIRGLPGTVYGGETYLFTGSLTDPPQNSTASAQTTFSGLDGHESFGYSVSDAGDINGDGYSDVLIGAPRATNVSEYDGNVYLFYGPFEGDLDTSEADATMHCLVPGATAGTAISTGDLNGDGYADVAVGGPLDSSIACNGGAVYVFFGPLHGSYSTADTDATIQGAVNSGIAGWSLSAGGDVDGDGIDDLLVGIPGQVPTCDPSNDQRGGAALFFGPLHGTLSTANADVTFVGEHAGDYAGWSVSIAGDMDGDGRDDVVVGAPGHGAKSNALSGAVYVHYHSTSGTTVNFSTADARLYSQSPSINAGNGVAACDLNGDGYSDVVVGAPGAGPNGQDPGQVFIELGGPAHTP